MGPTSYGYIRGGHQVAMTTDWPTSWTRAFGGSSITPPNLGMSVLPTVPTLQAIFKETALKEQCVLRPFREYVWLKPVKGSIQIEVGECGAGLVLQPPKIRLIHKFCFLFFCLLNLPPANLKLFASFFGFYLLYMYRGQFVNQKDLDFPYTSKSKGDEVY